MYICTQYVDGVTPKGRKLWGRKLVLRCDECGIEFERPYNKLISERELHFCCNVCVNQSQISGKLSDVKKQIFLTHYGVEHPMMVHAIASKVSASSQDAQRKKRETTMRIYGVDHTWKSERIKEKRRVTCLIKYGVEHPLQSRRIWTKYWISRKKRGSFNVSSVENDAFDSLSAEFGIVERHVIVNGWEIDFYINSIDTYVQLDGIYWHGLDRPIDEIKRFRTSRDRVIYSKYVTDRRQNAWFEANGFRLIRVTDKQFRDMIKRGETWQTILG